MKESFYILYSNMFSLSCLKLSNMSQVHFKCNTSDHYKRNTVLVTFGLFFLTGRHQQKQILPGNMDGLFFGRLRWMGSKFLMFLWSLPLMSFPMSTSGGRLLRLDDLQSFWDEFSLFFVLEYKLPSSTAMVGNTLDFLNKIWKAKPSLSHLRLHPRFRCSHASPRTCLGSLASWWAWTWTGVELRRSPSYPQLIAPGRRDPKYH